MKLKPIKWRRKWLSDKSGSWEEARMGMFTLVSGGALWIIMGRNDYTLASGKCRSVADGKRKAEEWLKKQINKVVEG